MGLLLKGVKFLFLFVLCSVLYIFLRDVYLLLKVYFYYNLYYFY